VSDIGYGCDSDAARPDTLIWYSGCRVADQGAPDRCPADWLVLMAASM
jgi:hypothetical protein